MDSEHLLIRERNDFAQSLTGLLATSTEGEALARRARELVRGQYDWDAIGKVACQAIESVIHSSSRQAPTAPPVSVREGR
jgi:hypothetical protein